MRVKGVIVTHRRRKKWLRGDDNHDGKTNSCRIIKKSR